MFDDDGGGNLRLVNLASSFVVLTISYHFGICNESNESSDWETYHLANDDLHCKVSDDELSFFLKVPCFFRSHTLQYSVTVKCQCDDSTFTMQSNSDKLRISPMALAHVLNVGDKVSCYIGYTSYTEDGIISELLPDQKVKVRVVNSRREQREYIIDCDKVFGMKIAKEDIVDITPRLKAQSDLILKTQNQNQIAGFNALLNVIGTNVMKSDNMILFDSVEWKYIRSWYARQIYLFLFQPAYQWRIGCVLDGKCLNVGELWPYSIDFDYRSMTKGMDTADQQGKWEAWGYSCDLCFAELSYFEIMYHCSCCEGEMPHDYCLSCIHSIVQQHSDFKEILDILLVDYLHDDAIKEIVDFCVGSVLKFKS